MDHNAYIQGSYTANVRIELTDQGQYQGVVILSRNDGSGMPESVRYETDTPSATEPEAIAKAQALAHLILGSLEP